MFAKEQRKLARFQSVDRGNRDFFHAWEGIFSLYFTLSRENDQDFWHESAVASRIRHDPYISCSEIGQKEKEGGPFVPRALN